MIYETRATLLASEPHTKVEMTFTMTFNLNLLPLPYTHGILEPYMSQRTYRVPIKTSINPLMFLPIVLTFR